MAEQRNDPDDRTDPLRAVTLGLLAAMVLAVGGLIFYLTTYVQEQRLTAQCYQSAFQELNDSLQVARDAAQTDRAQLRTVVTSLTDPTKTAVQRREALDVFVAALDEADRAREAAPLPRRTCS